MPTNNSSLATLESAVQQLLNNARQNRTQLEDKWANNYAAFAADESREPRTWKKKEKDKTWKSRTYFDITRQKITAAVSLTSDILFKGGRVPFMLKPDTRSASLRSVDPIVIDSAIEANEEFMHRQFNSNNAIPELKRMLIYAATYGEMWVKSYVTDMNESWFEEPDVNILVKTSASTPCLAFEARSPWDIWYDLETGNVEQMEYVFERRMMTVSQIRGFIGNPIFIPKAIKDVIASAPLSDTNVTTGTSPNQNTMPPGLRDITYRNRPIEAYEAWCRVPRADADAFEDEIARSEAEAPAENDASVPQETAPANATNDDFGNKESDKVDIFVITVGGKIIAYQRDPGPKPYFREVWEDNIDGIGGRSIADNLETIQTTINGAIRSFENNTKLIANFIVAIKRRLIQNKDITSVIDEGGILEVDEEATSGVSEAMQQLVFTDITGPLTKAIDLFMMFADLSSNLPRAEQGQQSENPQTAFELQQRLDKSGKYLASVIRNVDNVIKWIAERTYEYNAGNSDLDLQKIPATVMALGFTSFENRFLRVQKLMQMLTIALQSPTLEAMTKIKWLWEEIGKAQDLESDQFVKTDEEMQADMQRQQQMAMAAEQTAAPQKEPMDPDLKAATIEEKRAKAQKSKADADAKRTEAAIKLGEAQNLAAKNQAVIEANSRQPGGFQSPG